MGQIGKFGDFDIEEYQNLFLKWEKNNFGDNAAGKNFYVAYCGVLEELGELSHLVLKSHQGIREAATKSMNEIKELMADALGDMGVYMFALFTSLDIKAKYPYYKFLDLDLTKVSPYPKDMFHAVVLMNISLGKIVEYHAQNFAAENVTYVCMLYTYMYIFAKDFLNLKLENIFKSVFDKVLKRDWSKDKVKGNETS